MTTKLLEAARAGGLYEVRLRVEGQSMRPLIPPGATLVVRLGSANVSPGAIVVGWAGEYSVVHRTVGKVSLGGQRYFLEKGDASPTFSLIRERDIVGTVSAIEMDGRVLRLGGVLSLLGMAIAWSARVSILVATLLEQIQGGSGGRLGPPTTPPAQGVLRGTTWLVSKALTVLGWLGGIGPLNR